MKTKKLLPLLTVLLTLAACGGDGDDIIVQHNTQKSGNTVVNNNRNTTGATAAQTRLEFPHLKGGKSLVIVHSATLNRTEGGINYCVEWDTEKNAQRWSCYQMYSSVNYHSSYNVSRYRAENDGSLSAECQYPNDPDLPEAYRMTADPYKYNGYDHGHICPSADRLRSAESNYQTFYITNMQPQLKVFNAGIWEKMEEQVRTWASACDTLFVCKGGTIDKQEHVLGQLTDQIKRENRIPVPRYFFMALLSKKGNNYKATAFWVEHLNEDHTNDALRNYAYSIDWLEQQTGIDFFCNLPDDIEDMVESKMTPSEWGLK